MKNLIAAILLLISSAAFAEDFLQWRDYSEADKIREAAFIGLLVVDYAQTQDIKRHDGMYETNKMLGKHPSSSHVRNYFIASAIGHAVIAGFLPKQEREVWQWAGIILESAVVIHNRQIGLNIKF